MIYGLNRRLTSEQKLTLDARAGSVIAAAAVTVLLVGCGGDVEPQRLPAPAFEQLQMQLEAVNEKLERLTGNPEQVQQEMERIRSQAVDASQDELTEVDKAFEEFRSRLPVLAAIEFSEDLAAIDWLLEMRVALAADPNVANAEFVETLFEQVPPRVGSDTVQAFASRAAERLLDVAEEISESNAGFDEDVEVILSMLSRLESPEKHDSSRVKELISRLEMRQAQIETEESQAAIESELEEIRTSFQALKGVRDRKLRQLGLLELSQSLQMLALRVATRPDLDAQAELEELRSNLDEKLQELIEQESSQREAKIARAKMSYQSWAMGQVRKAEDLLDTTKLEADLKRWRDAAYDNKKVEFKWADFRGTRRLVEESIGPIDDSFILKRSQLKKFADVANDRWYHILCQVKHDAAKRHLLHIDPQLLDPPVARFYRSAMDLVWLGLEDCERLQRSLAKATAVVPKRSLTEFIED